MKHEGGLTRVVEMVIGKCGQTCEIHRIMSQQDCLLTALEVFRGRRIQRRCSGFWVRPLDGSQMVLQFTETENTGKSFSR